MENCNKVVHAFLDIDTYSSLIKIPKASKNNSLYLNINLQLVDTAVHSSFSVSVKLQSVAVFTKGLLIQSYSAVLIYNKIIIQFF